MIEKNFFWLYKTFRCHVRRVLIMYKNVGLVEQILKLVVPKNVQVWLNKVLLELVKEKFQIWSTMLTQLRHLGLVKKNFRVGSDILLGDKILDLGLTFYLVFECHVEMSFWRFYKGCHFCCVNSGVVFVFCFN